MPRLSSAEVEAYLQEAHVAVLSVSRMRRGPVAVPIWYEFAEGRFWMITHPESLHGRIMRRTGRATLTVRSEDYGEVRTRERYVMAEGPVVITSDDVEPLVRRIRSRYYTGPHGEEWVGRPLDAFTLSQRVTVLQPETLSGYEWIVEL